MSHGETPPAPVPTTGTHLTTPGVVDAVDGSYRLGGLQCGPLPLPSFVLPPSDVIQLRIAHGSCRKPHGYGDDAFDALDQIIGADPANPLRRPHQLFLTGDQIYADDVADVLLYMLRDAATALLGWTEVLPERPRPSWRPGSARASSEQPALPPATGRATCSPSASSAQCTSSRGRMSYGPAPCRHPRRRSAPSATHDFGGIPASTSGSSSDSARRCRAPAPRSPTCPRT